MIGRFREIAYRLLLAFPHALLWGLVTLVAGAMIFALAYFGAQSLGGPGGR